MSNYAINVRCSKCGQWVVVNDPPANFDKYSYICDDCVHREFTAKFDYLKRFYFWVEKNHPRIINEFLKRGLEDVIKDG